jgi:hypothetical protein
VNEPALWMMSINAFAAVLGLLSLLAGAVWLLTIVFAPPPAAPSQGPGVAAPAAAGLEDAAVIAAIHATVMQLMPGGAVSRIEEAR